MALGYVTRATVLRAILSPQRSIGRSSGVQTSSSVASRINQNPIISNAPVIVPSHISTRPPAGESR